MISYDNSYMVCDGCGKTFTLFNNDLVITYRNGEPLHLCKDCITNNDNAMWTTNTKKFTNTNMCDKI